MTKNHTKLKVLITGEDGDKHVFFPVIAEKMHGYALCYSYDDEPNDNLTKFIKSKNYPRIEFEGKVYPRKSYLIDGTHLSIQLLHHDVD